MTDPDPPQESLASKVAGWAVVWGIILGFTAAGLFFLIHGSAALLESQKTRSWPQAAGTILQSEAVHKNIAEKGNHWWNLKYEYQVNGKVYRGSRYAVGHTTGPNSNFGLRGQTYDLAEGKYHAGDTVTVHCDPENPDSAVLYAGAMPFTIIELVAGIVMTLLVLVIVFRSFVK